MFTDMRTVSDEILNLLHERNGAVSIRELSILIKSPLPVINRTIGVLMHEGWVAVEVIEGENFVIKAVEGSSSMVVP